MAQQSPPLVEEIRSFMKAKFQLAETDGLLVAVSGGKDSMCLLDLLLRMGQKVEVAHVNYQLRGADSDLDEQLVRQYCLEKKVAFHSQRFETEQIAKEKKQSIQVCARELRYAWFQEIGEQRELRWLATAHHLQDSLETFFINLSRGSGLKGLLGIPLQREQIIRPLLATDSKKIQVYIKEFKVPYRQDASNLKKEYTRNKVRLDLLPNFFELPGKPLQAFQETQKILQQHQDLFQEIFDSKKQNWLQENDKKVTIDLAKLTQEPQPQLFLAKVLSPLGFTFPQIKNMLQASEGALFFSNEYEACFRESTLFVQALNVEDASIEIKLSETSGQLSLPEGELRWAPCPDDQAIRSEKNIAMLQIDKAQFPLHLKRWQQGDKFQPLGMAGKQKLISDFFQDQKFSAFQKKETWLLHCGPEICWVVGQRIAEPFKLQEKNTTVLQFTWAPNFNS